MQNKIKRMKYLIHELNEASKRYYNATPEMLDREWDRLYQELTELENETNIIYPNSPTQNVGYKVVGEIKKVKLNHPMLSLDKCHTKEELINFANDKYCILSVKCDGLSTSLHYIDGKLVGAYTRGDGEIGGDVLNNVLTIKNIPKSIPYKDELIIDGETIIDWEAFKNINNSLTQGQEKYKHPRNLVSGTLNLLDSSVAEKRNMRFIAWRMIKGDNKSNTVLESFHNIETLGFEVVPFFTYSNKTSDKENLSKMLDKLKERADEVSIPYDGVVMAYNDIEYGMSLGRTSKFFRHSIAYKFEDQEFTTTLKDIEWSMGKTGQLTPVAIFEPVEIDGTMVERASLHNISVMDNLSGGFERIGDILTIYKANQIIPQIRTWTHTRKYSKETHLNIPIKCPVCGEKTDIVKDNNSKILICTNLNCKGKLLGLLSHAVSKAALNIDGLSESTIQKFIDLGWLNDIKDIYYLKKYYDNMMKLSGFGKKSIDKLFKAIESSREVTLDRFIYAHSIPLIGKTASKLIAEDCNYDFDLFITKLEMYENKAFLHIDGFGNEMGIQLNEWWHKNSYIMCNDAKEFNFIVPETENKEQTLSGLTFCITGSLNVYKNRDELKQVLESNGAKVTNSVTSKTTYLINNDTTSSSSKNKKAKELGIKIISENDVLNLLKKF